VWCRGSAPQDGRPGIPEGEVMKETVWTRSAQPHKQEPDSRDFERKVAARSGRSISARR
jgi:hypothetical protein